MGRLIELQCAEWLHEQGWTIENLEVLGGPADIEVSSPVGDSWAIEVKYIGQEDWDFLDIVEALGRGGVGKEHAVSLPTAAGFILFKVYTAAHQLKTSPRSRLALVVVSDLTWPRFRFVLENDFINWRSPRLSSSEPEWVKFINEQKKKFPNIEQDLITSIQSLDRV